MKKLSFLMMISLVLGLTACGSPEKKVEETPKEEVSTETETEIVEEEISDRVMIELSNSSILVDGEEISEDMEHAVYKANDIIFYLEDQGIEYGEGKKGDEHSQIEADAHTVVHITEPGTYEISGTLEAGQIFVDLGEDAEEDPDAVVNLVLNNADITCLVAPAILFYNVYECADVTDEENATMNVDTTTAGANIILADDSKNKVYGSYVAKIYKSCELNEDGTEVIDSKKLHKYDSAVYSKMSMNIMGDTGTFAIVAENEGLGTEMHLTILGGNISIKSGNDGINVNEDHASVFDMKGGNLNIAVAGTTGEGDGIDSNGWLLVNGGSITAAACATSMDAGIDADNGIYINAGTVIATGNMPAELSEGSQEVISFMENQNFEAGKSYEIKDGDGNVLMEVSPKNSFTSMVISTEGMQSDAAYTLWLDDTEVALGMSGGRREEHPSRLPGGAEIPNVEIPPSDLDKR